MNNKFLITFILLVFQINAVICCSCRGHQNPYPVEDFNLLRTKKVSNQIIFAGKIIEVDEEKENKYLRNVKLTFEVTDKYKGRISDIIEVETAPSGEACGISYSQDKEWIIFATQEDSSYQTNSCMRSVNKSYIKRYNPLKRFLDIISKKINGKHEFYKDEENKIGLLISLEYSLNAFHGKWEIWDTKESLLEQREYQNGQKHGEWKITLLNAEYAKKILYETYSKNEKIFTKMVYRNYSVKNGKLEREELIQSGQKGRLIRKFDNDGKLKSEKLVYRKIKEHD